MKSIHTVPAVALALALGIVLAGGAPNLEEASAADRVSLTRPTFSKVTPISGSIALDSTRIYAYAVPPPAGVIRSAGYLVTAPTHDLTGKFVVRNGSRAPITVHYRGADELDVVIRRQADGVEVWRGSALAEPSAATQAELTRLGALYYEAQVDHDLRAILSLNRRISELNRPTGAHTRIWGGGESIEFRLEKAGAQVPVTDDWRGYTISVAHASAEPALRVGGDASFSVHTSVRRM